MRFWRQFFAAAIAAPPPSRGDITGRSKIVFRPAAHRDRHWFLGIIVSFAWLFFLFFKTKSNTVTLCFLNTKQEEVESLPAAWGLALGISSDVAAQQGSCRAWTRG
jgi:hypothetical protein